jgi:hypothetical protein
MKHKVIIKLSYKILNEYPDGNRTVISDNLDKKSADKRAEEFKKAGYEVEFE